MFAGACLTRTLFDLGGGPCPAIPFEDAEIPPDRQAEILLPGRIRIPTTGASPGSN